MCSSPKYFFVALFVVSSTLLFGFADVQAKQDDWGVTRTNRWAKVARGWERIFLKRPRQGKALRELLVHYRKRYKRGGYKALLQQLSRIKKISAKQRRLAQALVALQARDTQRAIPWLSSLLSQEIRQRLQEETSPLVSRQSVQTTKVPTSKVLKPLQLSRAQRRILEYWAQAHFLSQQWLQARQAYLMLLHKKMKRRRKIALYRKLLLLDEKEGRWGQVQEHYKALIQLRPRDASLRQARARVLLRLGQKRRALRSLQSSI